MGEITARFENSMMAVEIKILIVVPSRQLFAAKPTVF